MRHTARQRKKKPLKLFTKQMLHSKSTYFYKQNGSDVLHKHFINGLRWTSPHREMSDKYPTLSHANRTRSSREKSPYNKMLCGERSSLSTYILPVACSLALLLVLSMAINPTIYGNEKSYALGDEEVADMETVEELDEPEEAENSISQQAELTADTDDASISLIVDDGVIRDTILADTGSTTYYSHSITIKGDNVASYSLQISATHNGTSALQYDGGGVTIPGANGKKGSELTTNTWGYGWGDTNVSDADLTYYTLPEYGTSSDSISNGLLESVQNIQEDSVDVTKKLTFAANFGNVPDGHYTTNVMLSLAMEPKKVVLGFGGVTVMQDMSADICKNIPVGTEGKLEDLRDGKTYWVAKLKDENCWMTQNLAFDLEEGARLTAKLSDVSINGWYVSKGTQHRTISELPSDSNSWFSYNPGEYYYTTPIDKNPCDITNKLSACPNWQEMIGLSKDTTGDVRAHYLSGNYYVAYVATSASGTSTQAPYSICPAGWTLPDGLGTSSGSFGGLTTGLNASLTSSENNLKLAPYYFPLAGDVITTGLSSVGSDGFYRSGRGSYTLFFNDRMVDPQSSWLQYFAMPVRCIARQVY